MFENYRSIPGITDEVFHDKGVVHPAYIKILERIRQYTPGDFNKLDLQARQSFLKQGITFTVGSDKVQGEERIFPFDLLPRIIAADEWEKLEKGVVQRNLAINAFLHDIYQRQHIFKDKVIPRELVISSRYFCRAMQELNPAGGIYNHISGTDLIRHSDGEYYVLEDNVRTPSGISYVLANREAIKRSLNGLFSSCHVRPLKEYLDHLLIMVHSVAPQGVEEPACAVLTDGMVASAYFEHAYLAQSMGIPLVEGRDLFVEKDKVYMKTTRGAQQLNVLYRRVEDEFLDPLAFLPDSVYGVPGIMEAYRKGNISLINAPGTGAADDKAVYSYVPAMIRYYLQEEPILQNVHTYHCTDDEDYHYVLEHMQKLVVKPVDEFGGYGMLVGNAATKEQLQDFRTRIRHNRRKYIAQPIMSLSTHPTFIKDSSSFEPRHIDLRLYTLLGKDMQYVLQGGLTRVALTAGNLVVNSSQGGGSKDTWVLAPTDVASTDRTAMNKVPADSDGEAYTHAKMLHAVKDRKPLSQQQLAHTHKKGNRKPKS
ncbi:hypothetical protein D770_00335 [Flammeovirgaceae bacterium 311]|nr:hypothetical protein D770_00335 [Flammeovirgaceae bacterium 311]